MALGQFQHALEELMSWLIHTEELLDAQRPISGDPKVIEVELAKHHVSIFIFHSKPSGFRLNIVTRSLSMLCVP